MLEKETIIGVGKDKDFEPADYTNVARGDAAVCVLEERRPRALQDLITYFEGFARGMKEAEKV